MMAGRHFLQPLPSEELMAHKPLSLSLFFFFLTLCGTCRFEPLPLFLALYTGCLSCGTHYRNDTLRGHLGLTTQRNKCDVSQVAQSLHLWAGSHPQKR